MNKKGFTLIEVLVVLVMVSILVILSIPSISDMLEKSKQKAKEEVVNMVRSAAEMYASDYDIGLAEPIEIDTLCKNYLKCPIKDPITDLPITGYVYSRIDKTNNNTKVFELVTGTPVKLYDSIFSTYVGNDVDVNKYAGNALYKWNDKYIYRGGITKSNVAGLATQDGYLTDTNSGSETNNYVIVPWDTSVVNCSLSTNSCYRIISINEDNSITIVRDRTSISSAFDTVHNTSASIYYSQPATNYGYADLLENTPLPIYSGEYRPTSIMFNSLYGTSGYEKTTLLSYSKMLEKMDVCLNKYDTIIGINRADYATSTYVKDSCDVQSKTGVKSVYPLKGKYIRLLYPDEYLNSSTEPTCTISSNYQCRNQNYLYTNQSTLSLSTHNTYSWVTMGPNIRGNILTSTANTSYGLRPVVTLRENVIITSGTGTQANPYVIAN